MANSIDPRVDRLPQIGIPGVFVMPEPLDQFGTFEVFVQPKEGKPFQHEGAVHAPDLELAFVLAKETFTRRFTCVSLCVTETRNVFVSPFTEGTQAVWDIMPTAPTAAAQTASYEIFYLPKRGKQHLHACSVEGSSPMEAITNAREKISSVKQICNIWAIRTSEIFFTSPDEKDFWMTLPDKKFRDASDYKGGDKLQSFISGSRHEAG